MAFATDETTTPTEENWGSSLDRLGTDRLLVLLAACCAIGFGTLSVFLQLMGTNVGLPGFAPVSTASAVFTYAITLVFGVFLLLAFQKMRGAPTEGAVLGLAFSIVLLFFGATAGMLAGLLGLVGALLGLLRNLKFAA